MEITVQEAIDLLAKWQHDRVLLFVKLFSVPSDLQVESRRFRVHGIDHNLSLRADGDEVPPSFEAQFAIGDAIWTCGSVRQAKRLVDVEEGLFEDDLMFLGASWPERKLHMTLIPLYPPPSL